MKKAILGFLVVGTILAAAAWYFAGEVSQPALVPQELPPVRSSTYRNVAADVKYVGAQACAGCHAEVHDSYAHTAHAGALAEVDLAVEPEGGEVSDPRSQKRYHVERRDGQLYHEEYITTADPPLRVADYPARYTIGSGRFSRSYLIEQHGFLYESPATWYAARPGWGLSPGYEQHNPGFQRPVELRCLVCHAGRIEPVGNSPQRVTLHTLAIDCERCHGAGSLHVEKWESRSEPLGADELDDTIVNPRRLDRDRREDTCAQCHLHSAATVELRGRSLLDYRPSLHLADFVTHFGQRTPKQQMEVVGHMEQMRLSRCYQHSDSLTCTTCHDPHVVSRGEESTALFRSRCLSCHDESSCRAPHEKRQDVQDNCVVCHMPRGDTEIPHFAFTHHRIGIHSPAEEAAESSEVQELVPLEDDSWQPAWDRQRNLGLAYMQFSVVHGQAAHAESYLDKALELLLPVQQQGPLDAEVESALARIYWGRDPQLTLRHAHAATKDESISPEAQATACFTLGSTYYEMNRFAEAKPWLERTVQLRPNADVWIMLSDCYEALGDLTGALDAARQGAELAVDRPLYVQRYAELLARSGREQEARVVAARIPALEKYRRQVGR